MGIYETDAFLIKDINKVSNNFTCGDCQARFTQSCHLARHAARCKQGRTHTECPGNKVLAPESDFEKAFYPEGHFGTDGVRWSTYRNKRSTYRNKLASTSIITSNPLPGWAANFPANKTKHIRTRSSMTLSLIKTKQRQSILHAIFLMKANMYPFQYLSLIPSIQSLSTSVHETLTNLSACSMSPWCKDNASYKKMQKKDTSHLISSIFQRSNKTLSSNGVDKCQ